MPSLMMLKAILEKAKFRFPPKTSTLSENLPYREKTKTALSPDLLRPLAR